MNRKNLIWGVVLVLLGGILGANALGLTRIDLFFDGWWTLFLIVPSVVGLVQGRDLGGNLVGLGLGVALLLVCQGILRIKWLLKLAFPLLLIGAGLYIIFQNSFTAGETRRFAREKGTASLPLYTAAFASQRLRFDGQVFGGVKLSAVFGTIQCDLTGAEIPQDVLIDAEAIFGTVKLMVPSNVVVRTCSNSCFGGVQETGRHSREGVTVYVRGTALFGGVEVL